MPARTSRRAPSRASGPWRSSSEQALTCSTAPACSAGRTSAGPPWSRPAARSGWAITTPKPRPRIVASASANAASTPAKGTSASTQRAPRGPWAMPSSSRAVRSAAAAGWSSPPACSRNAMPSTSSRRCSAAVRAGIVAGSTGKYGEPTCGVTVAATTPAPTMRAAWRRAAASSGAPSSTPGRRWRCRSTRLTPSVSPFRQPIVLPGCKRAGGPARPRPPDGMIRGVLRWWQRGAIYQVYPRSFCDADGDGVGDLPGVLRRLNHLVALGVEALWLSPFYRSPMADFGYDISDYEDVDPVFGTLADVDALIAAAHERGLRVVLDWVPNHTSDQHAWFRDPARRRRWYVWRERPNGWQAQFRRGGSAWTRDEATGDFYLHSFLPQQPDLNWDEPDVEAVMHDVLRFWLRRGVDGFR